MQKITLNQGEFAPRSKLPREIWRWLLGFSLKGKTKNVRRDFSNGYVIAEVLHQYFPMDIQLPEFRNGESFPIKMANWQQLGMIITLKIQFNSHHLRNVLFSEAETCTRLFYNIKIDQNLILIHAAPTCGDI